MPDHGVFNVMVMSNEANNLHFLTSRNALQRMLLGTQCDRSRMLTSVM